jgi:hypothetical protein
VVFLSKKHYGTVFLISNVKRDGIKQEEVKKTPPFLLSLELAPPSHKEAAKAISD